MLASHLTDFFDWCRAGLAGDNQIVSLLSPRTGPAHGGKASMLQCPGQNCHFRAKSSDIMRHLNAECTSEHPCVERGTFVLFAACQVSGTGNDRWVYVSEQGGEVGGHDFISFATIAKHTVLHSDIQAGLNPSLDPQPVRGSNPSHSDGINTKRQRRAPKRFVPAQSANLPPSGSRGMPSVDGESTMQQLLHMQQLHEQDTAELKMAIEMLTQKQQQHQPEMDQVMEGQRIIKTDQVEMYAQQKESKRAKLSAAAGPAPASACGPQTENPPIDIIDLEGQSDADEAGTPGHQGFRCGAKACTADGLEPAQPHLLAAGGMTPETPPNMAPALMIGNMNVSQRQSGAAASDQPLVAAEGTKHAAPSPLSPHQPYGEDQTAQSPPIHGSASHGVASRPADVGPALTNRSSDQAEEVLTARERAIQPRSMPLHTQELPESSTTARDPAAPAHMLLPGSQEWYAAFFQAAAASGRSLEATIDPSGKVHLKM